MVPGGRRAGAVAPVALVEAALRALLVVCRAGGDRAVAGAGLGRARGRLPSGSVAVHGIAGAAAERGDAERQPGLPGDHHAVACGAGGTSPESGEAGHQFGAAGIRAGAVRRRRGRSGRGRGARPDSGAVERPAARATAKPAMGYGMEPAADCQTSAAGLPGRQHDAHQPRGHLPGALRPEAWCVEARADGVPAHGPGIMPAATKRRECRRRAREGEARASSRPRS